MPPLSQQQREEFLGHVLASGKFNKDEAMMMLAEAEGQSMTGLSIDRPTGQVGLENSLNAADVILPTAGAVVGGAAVPMLAERYLPRAAAAVPRAIQTGIGVGLGTTGGALIASPKHPKEAVIQGLEAGGVSATAEGFFNLLTRSLGSMGGVQQPAVTEALSRGTGAKTMFRKPPTTAEAMQGEQINEMLKRSSAEITPGRLATESTLSSMPQSSVSISKTLDALNDAIEKLSSGGIGSGARASLTRLKGIRADLMTKYIDEALPMDIKGGLMGQEVVGRTSGRPPRQFIDPHEADYINQQIQDAVGNAYGKPGGKESMRTLKGIGAVHTESFRAQTGTQASAAATQRRLEAIESMRKQISTTTPEAFVRGVGDAIMTSGESGDQSALIALREFDKSGRLEKQIRQLAAKREWTGSQSRIAHNIKWEFVRRAPRFLAKLTGVATRPAGVGFGALAAFTNAMNYP